MYQEETDVGLGNIWIWLSENQTESPSRVSGDLFAGNVASFEIVDFKDL